MVFENWPRSRPTNGRMVAAQLLLSQQFRWTVFGICLAVYAVVVATVPTNYGGDTHDYLNMAKNICTKASGTADYNYMRGYGYPAFICLFSGGFHYIDAIYYAQGTLFLVALIFACKELRLDRQVLLLVVAVAAIPYYAYLQKLLYPDGLIASLVLFYLLFIAKRQFVAALVVAALLAFTKLVFVFLFGHLLLLWLLDTYNNSKRFFAGLVILGTCCLFLAQVFLLPGLSFMVTFVRPMIDHVPIETLLPNTDLKFECAGVERTVRFDALDFSPVREVWQFAPYGPLSKLDAQSFQCSDQDIRKSNVTWSCPRGATRLPQMSTKWESIFCLRSSAGRSCTTRPTCFLPRGSRGCKTLC